MRKRRKRIWRALALMFSILFAFSTGMTVTLHTNADDVNHFLGLDTVSSSGEALYQSDYDDIEDLYADKLSLIQEIVQEGCVLLKNDNDALPLSEGDKISVFGRNSTDWVYGISGGASTIVKSRCKDFKTIMEESGFVINPVLWESYLDTDTAARAAGMEITIGEVGASHYTEEIRASYGEYNDAALVVISRSNGESADFSPEVSVVVDGDGTHGVLQLQDNERVALQEAKRASDKVIVILNSDHPLEIEELKNDSEVDAIIQMGGTGVDGLYGFARVLNGTVSPSGHLTDTYAVDSTASPAMQNFGDFEYSNSDQLYGNDATLSSYYVIYKEGIYIGYKYYETRYEDCILEQGNAASATGAGKENPVWNYEDEVSYSFGYGMSYTTFEQTFESLDISDDGKTATVTVTVENTGNFDGKDVVQVYGQAPYTDYDRSNGVEKSSVVLLGFAKTNTLEANGGKETVEVEINLYQLASYDDTEAKTYIMDAGTHYLALGNGAHDALNNILAVKGYTTTNGMDYNGNAAKVKSFEIEELDTETFAISDTGTKVTNHMDDADINYYSDKEITYLSRNDWESTFPTPERDMEASDTLLAALVDGATYEENESLDMSDMVYGSTETDYTLDMMIGAEYDDPRWEALLNQMTLDEMSLLVGRARVKIYECPSIGFSGTRETDGPAGVSGTTYITDQEEYAVSPVMFQSEVTLACTFNQDLANRQGRMFGNDALWTQYAVTWAPGLNTHRTPYSGRNSEYFSEDAVLSYYMAASEIQGAFDLGLIMSPKHFCFNDQETHRGGLATFMTEQTAREIYLRPFEGAFVEGGALHSMAAFNRIGATFIGAHKGVMTDIVVKEWGFHGAIISDGIGALNYVYYEDGPASITAGLTMFACAADGYYYNGTLGTEVLESNPTVFTGAREAVHRILYMCVNSNAMNYSIGATTVTAQQTPWWMILFVFMDLMFAVLTVGCLGRYFVGIRKEKEKGGYEP